MKINIVQNDAGLGKEKTKIVNHFLEFLYDRMPLEETQNIYFLGKRGHDMTTGEYQTKEGDIRILSKGRMLIDVLRTLAHEWIHGAEHEILGWNKGPDIGGPNENLCNIYAAMLLKEYQNQFPEHKKILYS